MCKLYGVFLVAGLISINSLGQDSLNSDVDFAGFYGDERFLSIAKVCSALQGLAELSIRREVSEHGCRDCMEYF